MTEIAHNQRVEYIAAALVDFAIRHKSQDGMRHPIEEVPDLLLSDFGLPVSENLVTEAIEMLVGLDLAERIAVGHGRPFLLIESKKFDKRKMSAWSDLIDGTKFGKLEILGAYWKLGSRWLSENLPIVFSVEIKKYQAERTASFDRMMQAISGTRSVVDVPRGSKMPEIKNEIITLNPDDSNVKQAIRDAKKLAIDLEVANDIGNMTDKEVVIASREVSNIANILEGYSLRKREFGEQVKSCLSWIGEQAVGTIVGSSAMALLALIASIIGISL